MHGMNLGLKNCVVKLGYREKSREFQFQGICDHFTLIPVVSTAGQIMTQLVVFSWGGRKVPQAI